MLGFPTGPAERGQPIQVVATSPPGSPVAFLATAAAIIAALYLGRDVFIPLALSILISFALAPIATRLRRLHLGRVPSVLLVVAVALAFVGAFTWLLATQAINLAQSLPQHEMNLRQKIQVLEPGSSTGGMFDKTADMLRRMSEELEAATGQRPPGGAGGLERSEAERRPIPVEVHQPPSSPLASLLGVAGFLAEPLATAGIMMLFVVFVLLQREDLRDRFIRLFGSTDVHRTTQAMTDATERIGRYLLMQLMLNLLYGTAFGIGLYVIGVPNALLWGLIGVVLRFIPFVGAPISMLFPLALAVAVDVGWAMPMLVVLLFVGIEAVLAYVLEPLLFGSTTGLSPAAVVIVTVFWTVLWGPVGLLLATPLTACLVVIGRYVPQLHFLEVAFGNREVLSPSLKVYQRLLADDAEEAAEVAEDFEDKNGVERLYAEMLMPVLGMIDQDRQRGALDRRRQRQIVEDIVEIADDAIDEIPAGGGPVVACLPSRMGLDVAGARLAANLLREAGYAAGVEPLGNLARADAPPPALVCISQLNGSTLIHARRLVRRLRAQLGTQLPIVLGLWNPADGTDARATAVELGVERVVVDLEELLRVTRELVGESLAVEADAVIPPGTRPLPERPEAIVPVAVSSRS
ncbi:MAG TPA: AI-2E family transporter [Geminicoccaceae bacterium]|nr:AI-2E family transporter [Geminicoccus sp.]HMU51080.1 AI-2E family transporter [Geminicoccaceae bacterium]